MRKLIIIAFIFLTSCGIQPLREYQVVAKATEVNAIYSGKKLLPLPYPYNQSTLGRIPYDLYGALGGQSSVFLSYKQDSLVFQVWSRRKLDSVCFTNVIFPFTKELQKVHR